MCGDVRFGGVQVILVIEGNQAPDGGALSDRIAGVSIAVPKILALKDGVRSGGNQPPDTGISYAVLVPDTFRRLPLERRRVCLRIGIYVRPRPPFS
jgi:hypothetical protein